MDNRITVYKAYKCFIDGTIRTRTIEQGQDLPKGCYWSEAEAEQAINDREKAKQLEYDKHQPKANAILDKLEADIVELLNQSNANLIFTYDGDSQGIYDETLMLSTLVGGYEYHRNVDFNL